jgi:hypothetical protein
MRCDSWSKPAKRRLIFILNTFTCRSFLAALRAVSFPMPPHRFVIATFEWERRSRAYLNDLLHELLASGAFSAGKR